MRNSKLLKELDRIEGYLNGIDPVEYSDNLTETHLLTDKIDECCEKIDIFVDSLLEIF